DSPRPSIKSDARSSSPARTRRQNIERGWSCTKRGEPTTNEQSLKRKRRLPKESGVMRIAILTNEYPPHIYGGAGVHVEYLTRELARLDDGEHHVTVLCFGEQSIRQGNLMVCGLRPNFTLPFQDPRHEKFMDTLARDLLMAASLRDIDVIHCHTWYTHLAGCLARQLN